MVTTAISPRSHQLGKRNNTQCKAVSQSNEIEIILARSGIALSSLKLRI